MDWTGNKASIYKANGINAQATRESNDFYATDPKAIDALISSAGPINHNVWEPACGQGHLSKRLEALGYSVKSTDIIDRGYGQCGIDFLTQNQSWGGDIVTNPPYKYAQKFVEKALSLIDEGNSVFMFLKLTFLEGKARRELFKKAPPFKVHMFSERIACALNGQFEEYGGGAVAYAWYHWIKGYKGGTELKWI